MASIRKIFILICDIIAYFSSLFILEFLRYREIDWIFLKQNLKLFAFLFPIWAVIAYILDLWQPPKLRNRSLLFKNLLISILVFLLFSTIFLYIFGGFFEAKPKTNLILFSVIFLILAYWLKSLLSDLFVSIKTKVLFLDDNSATQELYEHLTSNPQLGYEPKKYSGDDLKSFVSNQDGDVIIVFSDSFSDKKFVTVLYNLLPTKADIYKLSDFYEIIFLKEPLEFLDEGWFVSNLKSKRIFNLLKRLADIIFSFVLLIILSPLFLLCFLLIKISSPGKAIFAQKRRGRNNKDFIAYKFRTMVANHDNTPWTIENDPRITGIGKLFRSTHLDELPQLYNILRGEMSFVGPRAESSNLADLYSQNISYYEIRNTVKPGLTGWAQIHYKPSTSVKEGEEKLKYDFFYIKNRSMILDFLIVLKTVKLIFVNPK